MKNKYYLRRKTPHLHEVYKIGATCAIGSIFKSKDGGYYCTAGAHKLGNVPSDLISATRMVVQHAGL